MQLRVIRLRRLAVSLGEFHKREKKANIIDPKFLLIKGCVYCKCNVVVTEDHFSFNVLTITRRGSISFILSSMKIIYLKVNTPVNLQALCHQQRRKIFLVPVNFYRTILRKETTTLLYNYYVSIFI